MKNEELLEETTHLSKSLKVIQKQIDYNNKVVDIKKQDVKEQKEFLWESRGKMSNFEMGLKMQDVDAEIKWSNEKIANTSALKKALNNPYFGRIDFNDGKEIIKAYIGLCGVHEKEDHYVFDWRAPISSLFYNYGIGKASYLAPLGEIYGEVVLKRQYKIDNGKLKGFFNSSLNIDDEILQDALASNSSDKMRNIVNTIQKEQNEIIRNLNDKYLIVQGVAGSGKTSVALHRIAYLLYRDKDLTSNNVLILSPNDIFSDYISDVLPELGEENVKETTFSKMAKSYLKDYEEIESFPSFIERYYNGNYHDKIIEYKLSDNMKTSLDLFLKNYLDNLYFKNNFKVKEKFILKEELNYLLRDKYLKLSLYERVDKICEKICLDNKIFSENQTNAIKNRLFKALDIKLDIRKMYADFIGSDFFPEASFKITNKLNYEDVIGMLYLYFEIYDYPYITLIKHVIIDEAQDYNLLQLHCLSKIFPKASFTILGDINQTINPYYCYSSLNKIKVLFKGKVKYIELLKTYRSSEEIIEFSNKILNLNNVCAIRKNQKFPVQVKETGNLFSDIEISIDEMLKSGLKRIAIITKNLEEASIVYRELSNIKNICLVEGKKIEENVAVIPSYLSKGLEFDGVIACIFKDNPYTLNKLFYVVCTRAQHRLIVCKEK